jgi:hypothetical protein
MEKRLLAEDERFVTEIAPSEAYHQQREVQEYP